MRVRSSSKAILPKILGTPSVLLSVVGICLWDRGNTLRATDHGRHYRLHRHALLCHLHMNDLFHNGQGAEECTCLSTLLQQRMCTLMEV